MADLRQVVAALRYRNGVQASERTAGPRGLVAHEILQRATDAHLYAHPSAELVAMLMQVDLDQRIPPALYRAVAELLVWVYKVDRGDDLKPARRSNFEATR